MSVQSKFYQVTNQILLEYQTDQYKITATDKAIVGEDTTDIYMYQAEDGKQYCIDLKNINSTKYPDAHDSTYYYGGTAITEYDLSHEGETQIYGADLIVRNHNVGTIIKDSEGNELRHNMQINKDKLRLYILTGYVMNNIAGYSLRVKAYVNHVSYINENNEMYNKRISDYIYLLDWFMPKEELKNKDKVHWLSQPLYLNSKFYDRYIEVEFPSPIDIAVNKRDIDYVYEYDNDGQTLYMRGTIDPNSNYIIEFSTVSSDNMDKVAETASPYECTFIENQIKEMAISRTSNANNFRVKLFEDPESKAIMYYPIYGDGTYEKDFDIDLMSEIEYGAISMFDESDMDLLNNGMDDFIEMYGDEVFKWVIINELSVTYNYGSIVEMSTNKEAQSYSEYYTNTIDYTEKTANDGNFWESRFIPFIKERNNSTCRSIVINYTAHLFNRMNNIDIIRTASMTIKNPYKYTLNSINTDNVIAYKIVNKIEKQNINFVLAAKEELPGKIIRSYYDTTNILAKNPESGQMYTNGKMTFYLKHTNNNYKMRLYILNDDNTRVPFNLTGPTDYKLVFPNISGGRIEIFPNKDSEYYNLSIGSLMFYITSDKAAAIMNVPTSERYFAIMTHIPNNSQEESTIYEGLVEWV